MIYISISIVVLALTAFVAWDLWRSKRKRKAPVFDVVIDHVGQTGPLCFDWRRQADIINRLKVLDAVEGIEAFARCRIDPVGIVFRNEPIRLPTRGIAAGVYHSTSKGWNHAWIELYSMDALAHELLHHATGLEDTPEFRALFERFKLRTP